MLLKTASAFYTVKCLVHAIKTRRRTGLGMLSSSSLRRAIGFACLLLECTEACEILTANVADGYGEGATIDGNCITITPGCNDLGTDAFRESSVNTVTVEYKSSTLTFNNNALRDLSGTVTFIRSTSSPGPVQ